MKKISIFCNGGLSNRLNALVGGLYLADKVKAEVEIYWPLNNWCDCPLESLITNFKTINKDLGDLFKTNDITLYISHISSDTIPTYHPNQMNELDYTDHTNIAFNSSVIPDFLLETSKAVEIIKLWNISENVLDIVIPFIKNNHIDSTVLGVHLRKTDMSMQYDDNQVEEFISGNMDKRFLVCSDNPETENKLKKHNNVIVYEKEHYVEKIDPTQDWSDNLYRSRESIIQAFVDMILLSRTTLTITNPISTFSLFAKLLKNKTI